MIYGYWNPLPDHGDSRSLSRWCCSGLSTGCSAPVASGPVTMKEADIFAIRRSIAVVLTPPLASDSWSGTSNLVVAGAGWIRRVYTGNGQLYALLILYYFIVLYAASGGFIRI